MENLFDLNNTIERHYLNNFEYNDNENYIDYYIEKSKNFENEIKNYSIIKSFKEEVEKLEKDDLKNLFKNIIDNNYYEIANFLIEKTNIDLSELFDLFIEKFSDSRSEGLLLSKLDSRKNIGFGILLNYIENGKNPDFIENLINNPKIKDELYFLYNSKYINKCPHAIDFLIEKALSLEFKEERLSNLIENIIKNNNLELFEKLLNNEKLINNIDFNKIIESAFINENINIINVLLKNKSDLKLESLKEEYKLFLLEYFFKNNFPEELKEKVISEILNKKEYICKYTNHKGQGGDQIKLDKIFKYNEQTEAIIEYNKGYSLYNTYNNKNIKDELLYEIKYLENNEKQIIYYEKGSNGNKELITAKINANNEIIFNTENINYDLKTFQNKINEILETEYRSIDGFDYPLSYLTYIPLQLQQNEINKNNIIFIADCDNIETIKNIINNSIEKNEYKNKIIICDFGYSGHDVQIIVCNGKVTIVNTLDSEERDDWKVAEKIQARFDKKIDVKEISILQQQPKNCVEASKLSTIALAMQFSNDFENFLELSEKLNKLEDFLEKVNKISENLIELTEEEKHELNEFLENKILTEEEKNKINKLLKQKYLTEEEVSDLDILLEQKIDYLTEEESNEMKRLLKRDSLKKEENDRLNELSKKEEISNEEEIKIIELLYEKENLKENEKNERQIYYINNNLNNKEYEEYFKLLTTITNSNQQLISKSQHFNSLQRRFKNFKNNFLKAKCNIELSESDKEFINSIINSITGNNPKSYIGLRFKNNSYEENIEHICDYLYKDEYNNNINAKNYNYKNPINGENYEINQKMRLFLISIKIGNIGHIHNYMEELKEYVNNDKNLIRKNIKNIIETNFKTKDDLYTKEVINIFNKEIEKIDLKEKKKIEISNSDISIINECLKKVNKSKNFKEATLVYSYDDHKQNEIYPHIYNENEIFLDHKTQCWLTAIKYYSNSEKSKNNKQLLDEYIDEFMEKLTEFIGKNNKKQIKEALEIIKFENFEIQSKSGNIYAKKIVDKFNEEIEKADLEENFINFSKNKIELENKKLIKIENNKDNKKTLEHINKLIEIYNNRHEEFKLKSIDLEFTNKSLIKDKKFTLLSEKDYNNLISRLNLSEQTTLNL